LENEPDAVAEPSTGESDVPVCVVTIGGVDGPMRVMLGVCGVLFEKIDSLFSGFSIVVGGPGEIFVGSVCRDTEEVVSLHQGSRDSVDGDGLEIRRRGDELEDVIDGVLLDVGGVHFRCGVDWIVFHLDGGCL
jgi:hypothetical protein